MLKVDFGKGFNQQYKKLVADKEELKTLINSKIDIFRKNSDDTRLRSHALHKHLTGKCAFSITDNIRIVYECLGENTVRFLAIGTHKEVYN